MSTTPGATTAAHRVFGNNAVMLEILDHLSKKDLVALSPGILYHASAILYRHIDGDIYDKIVFSTARWANIYRDSVRAVETAELGGGTDDGQVSTTYRWVEEARKCCPNLVTVLVVDEDRLNSSKITVKLYPEGGGRVVFSRWYDITDLPTDRPLQLTNAPESWPGYTTEFSLGIDTGYLERQARIAQSERDPSEEDDDTADYLGSGEHLGHHEPDYGSHALPFFPGDPFDDVDEYDEEESEWIGFQNSQDWIYHESGSESDEDEEVEWEEQPFFHNVTEADPIRIPPETLDKVIEVIKVDKRISRVDFGTDLVTVKMLGDVCRARIDSHGLPMETVMAQKVEPFASSDLADFGRRAAGLRHVQLWLDLSDSSVYRFAENPTTVASLRSIVEVVKSNFPDLRTLSLCLKGCRTADTAPVREGDIPVSSTAFDGKLERVVLRLAEKLFKDTAAFENSILANNIIPWFAIAKNLACLGSPSCAYHVCWAKDDIDWAKVRWSILDEIIKWYRGVPTHSLGPLRHATPCQLGITTWEQLRALEFPNPGRPVLRSRPQGARSNSHILDLLWETVRTTINPATAVEDQMRALKNFRDAMDTELAKWREE